MLRRARAQAPRSAAARSQAGSCVRCHAPQEIRVGRLYCRRPRPGEASGSKPVLQVCGKPKIQRVLYGTSREGRVRLRSAPSVHPGDGRSGQVLSATGRSYGRGGASRLWAGPWRGGRVGVVAGSGGLEESLLMVGRTKKGRGQEGEGGGFCWSLF